MGSTFKDLLLCFMKPNYTSKTTIYHINPGNDEQYIPLTQVYIDIKVLNEIENPNITSNKTLLNDFYFRAQNFLKVLCLH